MSEHVCKHCLKSYKSISAYDKHVAICNLKNLCKREDDSEYSAVQLTKMVKYLAFEVESLRTQVQEMKQYNHKKARYMIDKVLEKLYIPTIAFDDWRKTVELVNVRTVLENSLPQALCESFQLMECEHPPIYAFTEKKGVFYIYTDGKWRQMDENDWNRWIGGFRKKCTAEYLKLTDKQPEDFPVWINKLMHTTAVDISNMKAKMFQYIHQPMVIG